MKTSIDWLTVSSTAFPGEVEKRVENLLGKSVEVQRDLKGISNYDHRIDWRFNGEKLGHLCFGGDTQRGYCTLSLSGKGCQAADFEQQADIFDDLPNRKVTRVDIALDFYGGEVTLEQVLTWYNEGKLDKSGNRPLPREYKSFDRGNTLVFGSDKSMWLDRVYEKGKKEFHHIPIPNHPHHPLLNWVRWEAQHKPPRSPVPVAPSMYINARDSLLVSHRPILAPYLEPESEFIPPVQYNNPTTVERVLKAIRDQYGTHIFTLRTIMDDAEIIELITGKKHNSKLFKAVRTEPNPDYIIQ